MLTQVLTQISLASHLPAHSQAPFERRRGCGYNSRSSSRKSFTMPTAVATALRALPQSAHSLMPHGLPSVAGNPCRNRSERVGNDLLRFLQLNCVAGGGIGRDARFG